MTHYILIHGAWEAAWSWDETRLVLEQHGHEVTAIDLPGTKANDSAVPDRNFLQILFQFLQRAEQPIVGAPL